MPAKVLFGGIIFIRGGQYIWVTKIFMVLRDVISLVHVMLSWKLKKKNKQMVVHTWGKGCNFVGKGYAQKPRTFVSHEQWWLPSYT